MVFNKSFLLEQINHFIERSGGKDIRKEEENSNENISENEAAYLTNYNEKISLIKLEQRIEALENQNAHLLNLVHFIFDNFPGLLREIISTAESDDRKPGKANSENTEKKPYSNDAIPTRREVEILILLTKGLSAKEIAHTLYISETTVITHKKNLKEKFKARNTVELISKAGEILNKLA